MTRNPEGKPELPGIRDEKPDDYPRMVDGFKKFCKKNNLTLLEPKYEFLSDGRRMFTQMALVKGSLNPAIRLMVYRKKDLTASPDKVKPKTTRVEIDVSANSENKFMRPKIISRLSINEDSLMHLVRQTVPRLRKALRKARSIAEADLTELRPQGVSNGSPVLRVK